MSTDEYVPSEDEMREAYVWLSAGDNEGAREQAGEDFDRFLVRVRRDAAREALDGLSAWLGDLAEKHPARSAHVPLMQGHITRYITDNYPEGDDQ